jgi:hypothetical protein
MKIKKILYIFSIALSVIILNSCNELPTDMGSPLLFDTVGAVTASSTDIPAMVGNTKNILRKKTKLNQNSFFIGIDDDLKSGGLMIFSTDNFQDSLRNKIISNIESVQLKLYPYDYTIGDITNRYVSFDIYRVNDDKAEDRTWVKGLSYDDAVSPTNNYYNQAYKVGSYSGSTPSSNTDSIYIDIDKNLIVDWLSNHYPATTDTVPMDWGLMLVPNDGSKCVRRFRSPTVNTGSDTIYYNKLIIKYKDPNVANPDSILTFSFPTASEASFAKVNPPVTSNEIFIQSGIEYITQMDFDVSNIPSDASIVMAQLELTVNEEQSRFGSLVYDSTTALAAYNIYDKYLSYDPADVPLDSLNKHAGYYNTSTKKFIFRGALITAVEDWVYNRRIGHLWLFMGNTYNKLDRLVFYPSSDPDPNKRPKFKVLYTKKPKLSK